ncbi:hypothetical protein TNCV_4882821 [Trichonephila clavipes]|nr:hypothetical protein TNCV_4882821 [Trichonephila clavipes]
MSENRTFNQIPQCPPPVQIPDVPEATFEADSRNESFPHVTCADSSVSATCAISRTCAMNIPTCADSTEPPVQIPDVPEPVQIPVSQVPQPPMQILPEPMNILHVEPVQIPVSHVPQPPMQILHVSEPVQIPVSHVPQSPCNMQNLCRFQCHTSHSHLCRVSQNLCSFSQSSTCWTLWSRQMHSTSSCRLYLDPKNSSCFTRYPLFLMRISSLSWMKGSLWT